MPRAHRHYLSGQIWHLTHRCHEKTFLLRFPNDRRRYQSWLFEAKQRFGLCMLNFVITSNHVHLLVKDTGEGVIARSVQLAAGRTAQEYNQRKVRQGAFWEDRYHATAVEAGEHLHRCLVYIDLNMVRAGVVLHPAAWESGGYREIQDPPRRYTLIDLSELSDTCGFADVRAFRSAHRQWVEDALASGNLTREKRWSESIAVGGTAFIDGVKRDLGIAAPHRGAAIAGDTYALREPENPYMPVFLKKIGPLRPKNRAF
jgi:REP element-mobilizing transposase RayT